MTTCVMPTPKASRSLPPKPPFTTNLTAIAGDEPDPTPGDRQTADPKDASGHIWQYKLPENLDRAFSSRVSKEPAAAASTPPNRQPQPQPQFKPQPQPQLRCTCRHHGYCDTCIAKAEAARGELESFSPPDSIVERPNRPLTIFPVKRPSQTAISEGDMIAFQDLIESGPAIEHVNDAEVNAAANGATTLCEKVAGGNCSAKRLAPAPAALRAADIFQLVRGAQQGDSDAFGELIGRYGPRLRGWLRRKVEPAEQDDLFQEVLLRAYIRIKALKKPASFWCFLFGIALNVVREHIGKKTRRRRIAEKLRHNNPEFLPEERTVPTHFDAIEESDLISSLRAARSELSELEQRVIALRYDWRLSYKTMAHYLKLPAADIPAVEHRALQRLRLLMAASDDE